MSNEKIVGVSLAQKIVAVAWVIQVAIIVVFRSFTGNESPIHFMPDGQANNMETLSWVVLIYFFFQVAFLMVIVNTVYLLILAVLIIKTKN